MIRRVEVFFLHEEWFVEWKYSSFLKSNTETIAKQARLGPAKNDTALTENGRVDKVLLDDLQENPQKTMSSVYWR